MNTTFLIDGFNFYHSIKNLNPNFHWIDYASYCQHFLRKDDTLTDVYYFTALAYWKPDAAKRHSVFIEACKHFGIKVVLGKFKEKLMTCRLCKSQDIRHEEKETDVNIALYAYRLASLGAEQIFLVTGDTDLIPAIKLIHEDFPSVKVGVIFPFRRENREIKHTAFLYYKTTEETLSKHLLPLEIIKSNGKVISCPKEWR